MTTADACTDAHTTTYSPGPSAGEFVPSTLRDANAGHQAGERKFSSVADLAPVMIWMADAQGQFEYGNKQWLDFKGRPLEAELGSGWIEGVHPEDLEHVQYFLAEAFANEAPFEFEFRLLRADGYHRWLMAAGVPRRDENDQYVGCIGTCIDISERKEAQIEMRELMIAGDEAHQQLAEQAKLLHQLAESDSLTGVLNRRAFHEQAEREWTRAARYERELSCIMLDIDFFKKVNDTHGHAAGDEILKRVAELLTTQCRPSDRICRWGGEEFCVMLPETTEAGAVVMAERIRTVLAATPIDIGGKLLSVTGSFGVAERCADVDNIKALIDRADDSLHCAKHAGRNRVVSHHARAGLEEAITLEDPARLLSQATARELMIPTVCIQQTETIGAAVNLLIQHGIGSAPVVDDAGKLTGFISERDLMVLNVSAESWERSVSEVMKTSVVTYEESASGQQVFQFLGRVSIHRVVVVKDGRPSGVISPMSLLSFFRNRVDAETPSESAT